MPGMEPGMTAFRTAEPQSQFRRSARYVNDG